MNIYVSSCVSTLFFYFFFFIKYGFILINKKPELIDRVEILYILNKLLRYFFLLKKVNAFIQLVSPLLLILYFKQYCFERARVTNGKIGLVDLSENKNGLVGVKE